ncbi:LysR family transcriptional regulator [Alkaliphilus hydrothermalis]|uniref:DNA-binding transcriptional LysR family regulator n=1 Tax=Alkaliphilus hydrothermalis TaxID=1482730 RepID=A0ABS2NRW3_9FIRM|nr:LysR family transcriptional regulator [Alkaliphilus hydrothermalis]MBM7615710.1 DNA-binding transcriptional LysR family regulator [Alkaliphilus hydrothermalis]
MLDLRIESFLTVCKHGSYTRAAEELCITQPAVTQHIKALEKQYGCSLIEYQNRELRLTKPGEMFYKYAKNLKASETLIMKKLKEVNQEKKTLKFASTLTIGEFTLAPIMADFIKQFHQYDITMYVDNTEKVLKMLENGEINFALVEGLFNRSDYEAKLFKLANFILIAPVNHPLVKKEKVVLDDLKQETILLREKGSGSRAVLERGLYDLNYSLDHFGKLIELGNVNVIKNMVKKEIGMSFMYKDAAQEEITRGELAQIKLADFEIRRGFNFIALKTCMEQRELQQFFSFFNSAC